MKKIIVFLLLSLMILGGCSESEETNPNFIGVISDKYEDSYTLSILQGEILSSGDLVNISSAINYEIGNLIEVEYSGEVMESYPLQVNVISTNKVIGSGSIITIDNKNIEIMTNDIVELFTVYSTKDFSANDMVYIVKRGTDNYLVKIK